MVIGPSLALAVTPSERRASVGAMVFTGIGLGALLSASIVPMLLELSLTVTWGTLGLLCIAAGLLGDWGVNHLSVASPSAASPSANSQKGVAGVKLVVWLVIGAYALDAVGFVPHTVFWALLSQSVSSFMVGAMIPGIVALTSGRIAELVGPTAHKKLWGQATAAFAAAQALAGYAMSALYGAWETYAPLFAISGFMLAAGFLLVLLSRGVQSSTQQSTQQSSKHASHHRRQ